MNHVQRAKARWADEARWAEARAAEARAAQAAFAQFQVIGAQYMMQSAAYGVSTPFGKDTGSTGIPCTNPALCGGTVYWYGGQSENSTSGVLRWPDYYTLNISTGWPWGVVGVDVQVTIDRYGNVYGGLGGYGGTPGVTVFGGWILQKEKPNEQFVEGFVGQHTLFGGGGYWGGGGVTWGHPFDEKLNWNDFAGELGFSTPGGAGGYIYSWLLYDNGNPTPFIWQN